MRLERPKPPCGFTTEVIRLPEMRGCDQSVVGAVHGSKVICEAGTNHVSSSQTCNAGVLLFDAWPAYLYRIECSRLSEPSELEASVPASDMKIFHGRTYHLSDVTLLFPLNNMNLYNVQNIKVDPLCAFLFRFTSLGGYYEHRQFVIQF